VNQLLSYDKRTQVAGRSKHETNSKRRNANDQKLKVYALCNTTSKCFEFRASDFVFQIPGTNGALLRSDILARLSQH
jgi:hypothetical protein